MRISPIQLVCVGFLSLLPSACRSASNGVTAESVASALVDPAPASGRFLGFAKAEGGTHRVPVVLDLVRVGEQPPAVHYRAVLRLHLGSHGSADYASVYFGNVHWQASAHALTWAGGPEGISVVTTPNAAGDGAISGVLTSAADKLKLQFQLSSHGGGDAFAELPVAPSLAGSYTGSCPQQVVGLQLETSRWYSPGGGLFSALQASGRLLEADPMTCSAKNICLKEALGGGVLQPFTARLDLKSPLQTLSCSESKGQLTCGACTLSYDPISSYSGLPPALTASPRHAHLEPQVGNAHAPAHLPTQYYGYLHHEAANTYQLLALNMQPEFPAQAAMAEPVAATLQVGGIGTVFFGEGDSSEYIAYRFKPSPWRDGPLLLDGDGEAFAIIDSWQDDRLLGTWYSKTYGRIGSLELLAGRVPVLAAKERFIDKLSRTYKGDDWEFELVTSANLSEDSQAFFPLKIYGWALEKADHARRRTIKEGSYDFYTGRLALRLDDGRVAVGEVTADGLNMYWPPKPKLGTPLNSRLQLYRGSL